MTIQQSSKRVRNMLAIIRHTWRALELSRRMLFSAAGLTVWLFLMVLCDNLLILGATQMLAGWAALLTATVVWLARCFLSVWVRCPRDADFAVMYEARNPGFRDRFINSVLFLNDGSVGKDAEHAAVLLENAEYLKPQGAGRVIDRTPLKRAALIAVLCAGLAAAYGCARPAMTRNALTRLLRPAAPPEHILTTHIEVLPGNTTLLEGGNLVVTAHLSGHVPDNAGIQYRTGREVWITEDMQRQADGSFRFTGLTSLTSEVDYRVLAGRARSNVYRVSLRRRPRIRNIQITVTPPAYSGGAPVALEPGRGDVAALRGSHIDFRIEADQPLLNGALLMEDGSSVEAAPDAAEPHIIRAALDLIQDGSYRIQMTDTGGLHSARGPKYNLTALQDGAPVISIITPGRDLTLPLNARFELEALAEDDVGIAVITVQTRLGGEVWREVQAWTNDAPDVREQTVSHSWMLSELGIDETGQALLYRVRVQDRHAPTPHLSVSRTWSITVIDETEAGVTVTESQQRIAARMLEDVLKLQKDNLEALKQGTPAGDVRTRQERVRDLTFGLIASERQALRPDDDFIAALDKLAGGEMLLANQAARRYEAAPSDALKNSLAELMQRIIDALTESLKRKTARSREEQPPHVADAMTPAERQALIEAILAEMETLDKFTREQAPAIEEAMKIERTDQDKFSPEEMAQLNDLRDLQNKWAEVFNERLEGIEKLVDNKLAESALIKDYKELTARLDEAEQALESARMDGAPASSKGGEFNFLSSVMLAANNEAVEAQRKLQQLVAAESNENPVVQEESAVAIDITDQGLPEELYDLAGDLVFEADPLQASEEEEEEIANLWQQPSSNDPKDNPDWDIDDGPSSDFGASGVTGERLPDDSLMSGRGGDGREGRTTGQMIGETSKNLPGRQTPSRLDEGQYEDGVVEQLREISSGGATGGGKVAGGGQTGLQGGDPEPDVGGLGVMHDWEDQLKEKDAEEAGALRALRIGLPFCNMEFARLISLFQEADKSPGTGRYGDIAPTEEMRLPTIEALSSGDKASGSYRHIQPAYSLPEEMRNHVLDAAKEPVPEEFNAAQSRYFEHLSEGGL